MRDPVAGRLAAPVPLLDPCTLRLAVTVDVLGGVLLPTERVMVPWQSLLVTLPLTWAVTASGRWFRSGGCRWG